MTPLSTVTWVEVKGVGAWLGLGLGLGLGSRDLVRVRVRVRDRVRLRFRVRVRVGSELSVYVKEVPCCVEVTVSPAAAVSTIGAVVS